MVNEAIEIFKSYPQRKGALEYVQGLKPLYEEVFKALPILPRSLSQYHHVGNYVLDIGGAYGILALAASLRKDKVSVIDMTDKFTNLKMLEDNGIHFRKADLEKESSPLWNYYNLIIFTEVLEHLNSNPLPSIKKIYKHTRNGGHVVCTTPALEIHGSTTSMNKDNKPGLWNDLESWRDIPEYKGKWRDEHTFHYSQFDLVSLFVEAGFEIEDVKIVAGFSHLIIAKKPDVKEE